MGLFYGPTHISLYVIGSKYRTVIVISNRLIVPLITFRIWEYKVENEHMGCSKSISHAMNECPSPPGTVRT